MVLLDVLLFLSVALAVCVAVRVCRYVCACAHVRIGVCWCVLFEVAERPHQHPLSHILHAQIVSAQPSVFSPTSLRLMDT